MLSPALSRTLTLLALSSLSVEACSLLCLLSDTKTFLSVLMDSFSEPYCIPFKTSYSSEETVVCVPCVFFLFELRSVLTLGGFGSQFTNTCVATDQLKKETLSNAVKHVFMFLPHRKVFLNHL